MPGLPLALVSKLSTAARRLLIGRPFRSDRLSHTLLPKRIALPVFASDALSSVAYAPEEIFLMLSVGGLSAYALSPLIGLAVAAVMLVVVASYRQNVHAYPSGGGDYEVVTTNLGDTAGLVVASALMVDYVLTVAVSTASAMSNIGSALPVVAENKVWFCVTAILLVMAMNLRGVRESGAGLCDPYLRLHRRRGVHDRLGAHPDLRAGQPFAGGIRRFPHESRERQHRRVRAGVPDRAVILVRVRGADRCGGNQQRRAGVSEAQVAQRGNDIADAGRNRGDPVDGHHRAVQGDRRPNGRRPDGPAVRGPAELLPEDIGHSAGGNGVRQFPHRISA